MPTTASISTPPPTETPDPSGPRVLPASEHAVEPGVYRWDGFEPAMDLVIGEGWKVGHRHPAFFDLFVGGGFPGVGFGRFIAVHSSDAVAAPMTDAAFVVTTLKSNPIVRVEDVGSTALAGLTGLTIDLRVTKEQTSVFDAPDGTFHLDPGYVVRYHLLNVPGGGVLAVSVFAGEGRDIEDAVVIAAPLLEGLRLAD